MSIRAEKRKPHLERSEQPTVFDVYWAAGFYEGEGTVARSGQVAISKKNKEPLDRLRTVFGGNIRQDVSRGIHIWEVSGKRARSFLAVIEPLLSDRRRSQLQAKGITFDSPV